MKMEIEIVEISTGKEVVACANRVHLSLASLNLRTDRSDKHTDGAGLEEHFPLSTVPQIA